MAVLLALVFGMVLEHYLGVVDKVVSFVRSKLNI